jgi:hypothetical protein
MSETKNIARALCEAAATGSDDTLAQAMLNIDHEDWFRFLKHREKLRLRLGGVLDRLDFEERGGGPSPPE